MKITVSKLIFRLIKEKYYLVLLILFSATLTLVFSLLPPLILGGIVDDLTINMNVSFNMIFLYFLFLVLNNLFISLRDSLLVIFGQKVSYLLREEMIDKYINLDVDILTKQKPGSLVSRIIDDVDKVESMFSSGVISLFVDICQIIGILFVIWKKSMGLFVLLLLILPFVYLFTRIVQKNTLTYEIENRKEVAKANGFIPETIRNIITIHNLKKENYVKGQYLEYINKSYRALNKTNFYDSIYSPIILMINSLVIGIMMLLASSNNTNILTLFSISAGSAVTIINYIGQIFTPIESIGMEIQSVQTSLACIKRIDEFLSLPNKEEIILKENDLEDDEIVINDLSFSYGDNKVFENYNLNIKKGEHITLLGRTGAGKSTLFKIILGLYRPNDGYVSIFGRDPYCLKEKERRKVFGYVEQSFHPVKGTIKDQISLFDDSISDKEIINALRITGLMDTVNLFEKGIYEECKEELFSKGQWQILSVARAIVLNPSILMLDEISSGLDGDYEKELIEALIRASKDRTLISISHRKNAVFGRSVKINAMQEA